MDEILVLETPSLTLFHVHYSFVKNYDQYLCVNTVPPPRNAKHRYNLITFSSKPHRVPYGSAVLATSEVCCKAKSHQTCSWPPILYNLGLKTI